MRNARALWARLAQAPEAEQKRIIRSLSVQDLLWADADFESWAHESQLPPDGEGWGTWLLMAGRGFGKTRAGAEWVVRLGASRPGMRIALAGATLAEARAIMVEGVSGVLSVARRQRIRLRWEPALGRLTWPNGSEARLFSGENADGFRGPEHDAAWCDELAKWAQVEDSWANLEMGMRRGSRPRILVTTTPRPLPLFDRIAAQPRTVVTGGRTDDNINLDAKFVAVMRATYGGTRIGRQELDGELLRDVEGALWTRETIERCRTAAVLPRTEGGPQFDRIVVGVDPPAGAGEGCDACGIIVAGRIDGRMMVLADASVRGLGPEGWAGRVAAAALRWDAAMVVAEANNGGAMVASVLRAAEAGLRVKLVHASVGKAARAEPVAVHFETGRAAIAGRFAELEAELAGLVAGGDYRGPGRSPDRADAMVWALSELAATASGIPRVARI